MNLSPLRRIALSLGVLVVFCTPLAQASSHREALAVLNEPCADNTDTYAWVSNGTHDKLYLIMNFNPLHEPGQGNQGFRACNGYRYEFHIGKGTSLADQAVYRVEFKNTLTPEAAPERRPIGLGGGNELLWQLTGGTETMTVTRVMAPGQSESRRHRREPAGASEQPRPADRSSRLRARRVRRATTPAIRPAASRRSTISRSSIRSFTTLTRRRLGSSPDSSTIRISSTRKGIFDLVNLGRTDLGGIQGARNTPVEDVFTGFNVFSIALEDADLRSLPGRHSAQWTVERAIDRQPPAHLVEHQPSGHADRRRRRTSSPACAAPAITRRSAAMRCRSSMPAWSERSGTRSICTPIR